jgi:CubicO group peptidase (beta-lactamase class C family)
MRAVSIGSALMLCAALAAIPQASNRLAEIARAKALELDTPYVPPPGDPLVHHASGFAKTMCSAVFVTGLDIDFARENVGYFTAPYEKRAALGNLYLQDGVWDGAQILPEGYTAFVSTLAPAWAADHNPVYGGFFWINGDHQFPVDPEAYYMSGAGGQTVMIIPSHDLVVVRLRHFKGEQAGEGGFKKALALLMQATPARG